MKLFQIVEVSKLRPANNDAGSYQKLKYAFPHFFLDKVRNQDNEGEVNNQGGDVVEVSTGDIINISSSKSKSFYNSLLKMKVSEPTILVVENHGFWEKSILRDF